MSTLPSTASVWTRARFWGFVTTIFIIQAALIFVFAERFHARASEAPPVADFRVLNGPKTSAELARLFFTTDPTVFSLPSVHGFSGKAWLDDPGMDPEPSNDTQAPVWLSVNTNALGTNFPQVSRARPLIPFSLPRSENQSIEPWPANLAPDLAQPDSYFVVRGALARRQLQQNLSLLAWPPGPNGSVLSNTVVQIVVDGAGQVVATSLIHRSGSMDADTNALATARNLRFFPGSRASHEWSQVVFAWRTLEKTNVVSGGAK